MSDRDGVAWHLRSWCPRAPLTLVVAAEANNTLSVFGPSTGNLKGWGSVFRA